MKGSSLTFESFNIGSDHKRGQMESCQICKEKFGIFKREHVCKRCYRSVCDDCANKKAFVWKDNFAQGNHRICKLCRVEADAIRSYVKSEELVFGVDCKLAMGWKRGIQNSEEKGKKTKNTLQFSQEMLAQLWNSLTYSMRDFVGNVIGAGNIQQKTPAIYKSMREVLEQLNNQTEIRIQTAPYIVLLLLCYCNPSTAIQIGLFLINQLRVCQTERQMVNQTLKQLGCNQGEIRSMEDYIDQRMRKFVSLLGMNALEVCLVQSILQDTLQTPDSIVRYYGAMIATEKKLIMENVKDKSLIDVTILREGNIIQIRKNFNKARSKNIKEAEKKAQKKAQSNDNPKSREDKKNTQQHGKALDINEQSTVELTKSKSQRQQLPPSNNKRFQSQIMRTVSNLDVMQRSYGDQWKMKRKRKKGQKTGSFMDLSKDFQIKLRQMKSLGLQTVVSSDYVKKVQRIREGFEISSEEEVHSSRYQSQEYQMNQVTTGQSILGGEVNSKSGGFRDSRGSSKYLQSQKSGYITVESNDKERSKGAGKVASMANSIEQKINTNAVLREESQLKLNSIQSSYGVDKDTLTKLRTELRQSLRRQKQLQFEAAQLRDKVKHYQKVLPQKQTLLSEYRAKQKEVNAKSQNDNFESSKYRLQSRTLQQKIQKLQVENRRLEDEKLKLESECLLNRSSIPSLRDTTPQTQHDLSMLSARSLLRQADNAEVAQLKKEIQLMTFTLKQKNQFLQTLSTENKKLGLEYERQKKKQESKMILVKEEYETKIADLELERTRAKYENERLMKKLEEMTLKILSLQNQLIQSNRKEFDYQ